MNRKALYGALIALIPCSVFSPGGFAVESEPVRVGYFDLEGLAPDENYADVQRALIDSARSLKELVDTGNASLSAAQKSGASSSALSSMASDLQLKINAAQQDAISRAQSLSRRKYGSKAIGEAADLVARSHGLDILLNRDDVVAGESYLVKHGLNVNADMSVVLEKKGAAKLSNSRAEPRTFLIGYFNSMIVCPFVLGGTTQPNPVVHARLTCAALPIQAENHLDLLVSGSGVYAGGARV